MGGHFAEFARHFKLQTRDSMPAALRFPALTGVTRITAPVVTPGCDIDHCAQIRDTDILLQNESRNFSEPGCGG